MKYERSLQWFGAPVGRVVLGVAIAAVLVAAFVCVAVMTALSAPPEAAPAPPPSATVPQPGPDPHAQHAHPTGAPAAPGGTPAAAPDGPPPALDIVFDTVSDERAISVDLNTPFEFSVVARHAYGGVAGWEAHVIIDKRIAVLERKAEGLNLAPGEDNWQVGLGENCQQGDEVVLARYRAIVWVKDASDLVLGLAPIPRTSFTPPSPGYLTCLQQGDIRPMVASDTLAVVNPERVKPRPPDQQSGGAPQFLPVRDRH